MHLLLENISADLYDLNFTDLAEVDHSMMQCIASKFTSLVSLELSCAERLDDSCCWSCFEESSTCFTHSPIPDTYSSCFTLVVSACNPLLTLRVELCSPDTIQVIFETANQSPESPSRYLPFDRRSSPRTFPSRPGPHGGRVRSFRP